MGLSSALSCSLCATPYFVFPLPLPLRFPPSSYRSLLVYKISESCANKPQRRLHLIYLQQNVEKLKLLRKCNFALRVFYIRVHVRILILIRVLACFQHVLTERTERTCNALFGDRKHESGGRKSIELGKDTNCQGKRMKQQGLEDKLGGTEIDVRLSV